jgi:hypothetical protein
MTSTPRIAVAGTTLRGISLLVALFIVACTPGALRRKSADGSFAPYSYSRLVSGVTWEFSSIGAQRKALGSDLWPCAWAADDQLYCAWGDGGGFDGNDDQIGRVSLGFARVSGFPDAQDASAVTGKNVWGLPPYAENAANFGGKVGSIAAVGGVLYAIGGFWTTDNSQNPVHASGRGPFDSIAWSTDYARSWQLAPQVSPLSSGSFLDDGQDSMSARDGYVLLYYMRRGDSRHLYLERISRDKLAENPADGRGLEFFTGASWLTGAAHWSAREAEARSVFSDVNNVQGPSAVYDAGLKRFLLTVGHYSSGNDDDSSAGQVGLFEAANPWGPWATIGYYENWGNLKAETTGDFLSLRIPSKWLSSDGETLWAVFSGLKSFDSFNMVRGVLSLRSRP